MPVFDDDYPERYQHTAKVDVALPSGLEEPGRLLLSVSQRDELEKVSWMATYDLLPAWSSIEARIRSELFEPWRVHFEEWGFGSEGSELHRSPVEARVDDCLGEPHVIAQLSFLFTIADDGEYAPAAVTVRVTIDKTTGGQLDLVVE